MATQETLNQVQQLYVAYYGRPADAEGLAFWAEALEANGGDTSVIINDFGNSAEFEARFGEMTNEELVNNLYQQLFGRDAEAEGLAFYVGHLEEGNLSLAEIAAEIAGGAQDGEGNADATALANKIAAANLYTDATEGQHSGTDADNYAAEWLAGINADTDVEAIDMDEVVANLPEPTEPTDPEEPGSTNEIVFNTSLEATPGGLESDGNGGWVFVEGQPADIDGQTVANIGMAEWGPNGATTTSADYTFNLSNQIGEDKTYTGLFLSPLLTADTVTSNSQLFIELLDVRSVGTSDSPLTNLPIDGFRFNLDGEPVEPLRSEEIFAAETYEELRDAINDAIAERDDLAGFSAEIGSNFTATDGDDPIPGAVGRTIVLTDANGREISGGAFTYTDQETGGFTLYGDLSTEAPESDQLLIETNLDLNNVGFGSQGGTVNLVGQSASDKGIEKINLTAENGVWLTQLLSQSGTNFLKEVNVESGSGYLHIGAQDNENVDGVQGLLSSGLTNAGLVDVQNFNGGDFNGAIKLNAYISNAVIVRDLQSDDTQDDPTAEDVTYAYQTADGDDQISLIVNEDLLARADAQVVVNAGNGNNVVETAFVNSIGALTNQQLNGNITITTGSGDDVVRTWGAGDAVINTGAGDDVIYADNSGLLTNGSDAWQFNSTAAAGEGLSNVSNSDAPLSAGGNGVAQTFNAYGLQVTVSFLGFESTVNVPFTDEQTTALQINQALKNAINNDPVLQNLLQAEDGNGNILNVTSLIDGDNLGALEIEFAEREGLEEGQFSLEDLELIETIYGYDGTDGNDEVPVVEGAASGAESDNTINAGAGFDVIVLGTGDFSNDTVIFDGNFGTNTIVNFTAGEVASDVTEEVVGVQEVQTLDFTGFGALADGEGITIEFAGGDYTFTNETGSAIAEADIADAIIADAANAPAEFVIADDGNGVVELTAAAVGEQDDATVASTDTANDAEAVAVTITTEGVDAVPYVGANADILDFTSYGVNGVSNVGTGYDVANDQVNVVDFDAGAFDVNFNNLSAADVKAAIGETVANGRIDSIILVQNDTNAGEYKAFDVNSANNSTDFTVDLIGVLDFGATQDFVADNFA